ncbi:2-oxoacid ferredoxin oxidoreductase [Pelotomaculum schinkii]|uniref:Indolepyruvate oxidoreductase subunit IorA n=1 Tax=Pelotomaculum schinkii TaxID=78350 RepID=A0A4Y7RBG0_9FIRM|nr:thiamine pyrophosphate-dependent enzyme [Pelotomaculum schinkii]TEB06050.1 2-oxoacid ferredoxin oxidoreductase [Pelotomaculum schinkii]
MSWKDVVYGNPGDKVLINGNDAIARGCLEAGVRYASSYPGSPSSEITETLGKAIAAFDLYAEWSTNEIVALEGAAAASFTGLRAVCTMKSDGLNVALDFLTSMNLAGCKGGLVLVVADDPAAHSSLKEHDSRNLARAAQIPVLEPSTPDEARVMAAWAFALSEETGGPVILRSVTRVSHSRGIVELKEIEGTQKTAEIPPGQRFQTFSIFHMKARDRLQFAADIYETSPFNFFEGPQEAKTVLFCCGSSYLYARETLKLLNLTGEVKLVRVGTTYPLPENFILSHLRGAGQVIFAEEVRPVLEESVLLLYARKAADLGNITFHGKLSGEVAGVRGPACGEMNTDILLEALAKITGVEYPKPGYPAKLLDQLVEKIPPRDFAMCPGCPHRASFWAIKTAVAVDGRDGIINGDIGCYSLGAFTTGFELFDTLHCMGAGPGIACGLGKLKKFGFNRPAIAVVGDSTFYHAVIPGLINARYNGSEFLCIVLDNGATAMTGHQPHPGTGFNAAGDAAEALSIEEVVRGLGIAVDVSDPFNIEETAGKIFAMNRLPGVKVLILRQLCALVAYRRERKKRRVTVDPERCRGESCGCGRFCTSVWGCPGNIWDTAAGKAKIDEAVCAGCGVCAKLCPAGAIAVEEVD